MTLVVVVKAPVGIVMAADRRRSVNFTLENGTKSSCYFDDGSKIFLFEQQSHIAATAYGLELRPDERDHMYEEMKRTKRWSSVLGFARKLGQRETMKGTTFIVAGYGQVAGKTKQEVVTLSYKAGESEVQPALNGQHGVLRGGDTRIVDAIFQAIGEDKTKVFDLKGLGLQGCVDLAMTLIEATVGVQEALLGERPVGGGIDVVTITPDAGVQCVQTYEVVGIARARGVELVKHVKERPLP